MNIKIDHLSLRCEGSLRITGSKSETNRLLLLQALFKGFKLENISNSDDSKVMQEALESTSEVVDVHHAGTAMRFLTAYFSRLSVNIVLILTLPLHYIYDKPKQSNTYRSIN